MGKGLTLPAEAEALGFDGAPQSSFPYTVAAPNCQDCSLPLILLMWTWFAWKPEIWDPQGFKESVALMFRAKDRSDNVQEDL